MQQSTIYIGLNDAETHEQKFSTDKYLSILKTVCRAYRVAFSVHVVEGGYFHEDGSYVEETTLSLMLMDLPQEKVKEMARDLCAFFHQESVMITSAPSEVLFIHDSLEPADAPVQED